MLAPRLRTGEGLLAIDVRVLGPDDADLLETVAPEVFDNVVDRKLARDCSWTHGITSRLPWMAAPS
jgi:hypothetical protein